jgi:hypothetical protein
MLGGAMFQQFVQASPTTVMVRAVMEYALAPACLDALFAKHARRQHPGETLFSTLVDLMGLVVLRDRPTMHAAYQLRLEQISVSVQSIYNKLDGLEEQVCEALVRETAASFQEVLADPRGRLPSPLPGYRVLILDGNHLAGTEHRLRELRRTNAAALPGQVLALLDPATRLLVDVICEPDGHLHERTMLPRLYPHLPPGTVLIADRNFASYANLRALSERQTHFIIRQHARHCPVEECGPLRYVSRVEGGRLYEQQVKFRDATGWEWRGRRITIKLNKATRFGDHEIHLLTDLPTKVAARAIATAYRSRWSIEDCFNQMTTTLCCEIETLGYPNAALFGFCVAMLMYNILAVVKGALRARHGAAKIEREVSLYFLAQETSSVYHGMLIALPPKLWHRAYGQLTAAELAAELYRLAGSVNLSRLKKHPRAPKKPQPKRTSGQRGNHVATAKLLAQQNTS